MTQRKLDKKPNLQEIEKQILSCKFCNSHKQGKLVPGSGSSKAKLVFVGEAPGKNEILTGQPFIGRAGKVLREAISSIGLSSDEVFITSAVKYLPIGYVTPKPTDIIHGRIHLYAQLAAIKPQVLVVLGNTAANSLLDRKFIMSQEHGKILKENGITYFLSYHPAAVLYNPNLHTDFAKDFKKIKKLL